MKYEIVDLSDYMHHELNAYSLQWFQLLTYRKTKIVIYGVGQWWMHLMDWSGCNFMHGRLPKSPVFDNPEQAIDWLSFQVKHKVYTEGMTLSGHHSGENKCSLGCSDREIYDVIWIKGNKIEKSHAYKMKERSKF